MSKTCHIVEMLVNWQICRRALQILWFYSSDSKLMKEKCNYRTIHFWSTAHQLRSIVYKKWSKTRKKSRKFQDISPAINLIRDFAVLVSCVRINKKMLYSCASEKSLWHGSNIKALKPKQLLTPKIQTEGKGILSTPAWKINEEQNGFEATKTRCWHFHSFLKLEMKRNPKICYLLNHQSGIKSSRKLGKNIFWNIIHTRGLKAYRTSSKCKHRAIQCLLKPLALKKSFPASRYKNKLF